MTHNKRHTLMEVAKGSGLSADTIVRFIAFHWIIPEEKSPDLYLQTLDDEDLARILLVKQLQQDFGVNDESVPIILSLIDQLHRTHLEIKHRLLDLND